MPLLKYLRSKRVEDPDSPSRFPVIAEREDEFETMLKFYGLGGLQPTVAASVAFVFKENECLDVSVSGLNVRDTGDADGWARVVGDVVCDGTESLPQRFNFMIVDASGYDDSDDYTDDDDDDSDPPVNGPCIGLAPKGLSVFEKKGRDHMDVWSFNCRTGELYAPRQKHIVASGPLPVAKDGDEISILLFPDARVRLLKNGRDLGEIFKDVKFPVRPMVELKRGGSQVSIVPRSATS